MSNTTKGVCQGCGEKAPQPKMLEHLQSCRELAHQGKRAGSSRKPKPVLRLLIEGLDRPEYWLVVDTRTESTFRDLDLFLRQTWVECCDHLSQFTVLSAGGGRRGRSRKRVLIRDDRCFSGGGAFLGLGGPKGKRMSEPLDVYLEPGAICYYEYDFGSPTELELTVVAELQRPLPKGDVQLLARNVPPEIHCRCGKPAKHLCFECQFTDEGWLCDRCAKKHGCGEEMLSPIPNSPRLGVCGYTGD